jgi:hypothetical protein
MKTFREFIVEAYLIEVRRDTGLRGLVHGLGDSKEHAVSNGLRFFRGDDGRIREIRNHGSKSKPGGRVVDYEHETASRAKRRTRLHDVTPPEHQDHVAYARKLSHASTMGMDLHHMTQVHKSAKIKASMSDDEWQQRVKDDAEKDVYHGNHPRNLALTKRQDGSGPGISHHGTIHNKKRNNTPWPEISGKAKEVRQERRKQKRLRASEEIESN